MGTQDGVHAKRAGERGNKTEGVRPCNCRASWESGLLECGNARFDPQPSWHARLRKSSILNILFFLLAACSSGQDEPAIIIKPAHSYQRFVARASIDPPLWGIADTNGKWVVEPKYFHIDVFKSGGGIYAVQETATIFKQELVSLINDNNKTISSNLHRDNLFPILNNYIALRDPGRVAYLGLDKSDIGWRNYGWSVIDKNGRVVLPGPYKAIASYGDYAMLTGEDGRQYIVDSSTHVTYEAPERIGVERKLNRIDALFAASDYSECKGNVDYRECTKSGVINQHGEWLVQPRKYVSISWCREFPTILCIVADSKAKRRLEWLVDQDWNVLSPAYASITPAESVHDGEVRWGHYFLVDNHDYVASRKGVRRYSSLMTDEGVQIPNSETGLLCEIVDDRIAVVSRDSRSVLINLRNGKVLKTADRIYGYGNSSGVGIFVEKSPTGDLTSRFVDINGQPIDDYIYEDIVSLQDGVFSVKKGGLWGFIDKDGRRIIDHKFNQYKGWFVQFYGGLAVVAPAERKDLFGIINKNGDYVVPPGRYVDIWSWID